MALVIPLAMHAQTCEISYSLIDSYGDGWNNAAINVRNVATNEIIARWTILPRNNTASGTLSVSNGQTLRFEWVNGDYNDECSYIVYGVNGEIIIRGSYGWESFLDYTVNCDCLRPEGLNTSDVTPNSATLNWTSDNGQYNVRYQEAPVFFDDFENGLNNWTVIRNGEGNVNTDWMQFNAFLFGSPSIYNYSGFYVARSRSWSSNIAFSADNWLITPQVPLDGVLKFWVMDDSEYHEHYDVYVSTTSNTISDFTLLYEPGDASGTWTEVTVDLSSFGGTMGYIALRLTDYDKDYLLLDDFGIYANDWQTTTTTDNTITISGLNPNTQYQWQVQGITSDCNDGITRWSNIAYFTTASPTIEITANQWYAISTPMHDIGHDYLGLSNVTGLTNGSYDLFRYNEGTGTWENQKYSEGTAAGFATLEGGRGYIYRRATDATLSFSGEPNTGSFTNSLTSSCADNDLKGFNLIGNPYPHAIYKGGAFPSTGLSDGYYSLEPNGTWYAREDSDPIAMGQAVLVQASSSVNLAFSNNASAPSEGAKAYGEKSLRFAVNGLGYEDVAYARFSNGEGLRKIAHLNTEAPSLSIPQKGTDYAIAALENTTGDFPLSFHTATYGQFTLTVSGNTHFPYLHLFDRLTGRDIDLRAENSYTFSGAPADLAERFLISLSPGIDNAAFAYQNGNSIVVNGEGELQVFDVAGRRLSTLHLDGSRTCNRAALGIQHSGVYLLRLVGKEHKTQKLIVR